MFHGILDSLEKAINNHPESAISAIATVAGTLSGVALGLIGGHFLEQWRRSGKIKLEILGSDWQYWYVNGIERFVAPRPTHVTYNFGLRIHNTYPIAKTFEVMDIHFFRSASRFGRRKPLLTNLFVRVEEGTDRGSIGGGVRLFEVSANSFIRATLSGDAYPSGTNNQDDEIDAKLMNWRWARIRMLVSPEKIVTIWRKFPPEHSAKWPKQLTLDLTE